MQSNTHRNSIIVLLIKQTVIICNESIIMQLEAVIIHVVGMRNKKSTNAPTATSNNDAVCLWVNTEMCCGCYHNKTVNVLFSDN